MRTSVLALVVLAAVTGCGSGASPEAAGTSASTGAVAVWLEFVACARKNGQANWPDPVVDAGTGKATFPSSPGFEKPPFDAVKTPCGSILDKLPPQANPLAVQPLTPERLQALREYQQCLRENGLPDAPDPDANGNIPEVPEPPGGWPADLGQRRAQAFSVCDPRFADRLGGF